MEKGISSMTVDEKKVTTNTTIIPFEEGKKEYYVEVIMG